MKGCLWEQCNGKMAWKNNIIWQFSQLTCATVLTFGLRNRNKAQDRKLAWVPLVVAVIGCRGWQGWTSGERDRTPDAANGRCRGRTELKWWRRWKLNWRRRLAVVIARSVAIEGFSPCQLDEDQSIATLQEESMLPFRGGSLGMTSPQSTWQAPKSNGWNGMSANAFLDITKNV
jgi:hypothetical protein